MKKTAALIVTLALLLATLPAAFAAETASKGEKSIFQIINDSILEAYNARKKHTWKGINVFKEMKEKIDELSSVGKTKKVK